MADIRKRIGQILKDDGLVTESEIQEALEHREKNERLGDALIRLNIVNEHQMLLALEKTTNTTRIDLNSIPIDPEALRLFKGSYCKQNSFIPLAITGGKLIIAINDPLNYFVIDDIRFRTNYEVEVYTSLRNEILSAIEKHYSLTEIITGLEIHKNAENEIIKNEESSPMVKLVNQVINTAVLSRASDIHIDPLVEETQIKYRVDSVLYPELTLPISVHKKLAARIKVMAQIDVTETRIPQDGRISMMVDESEIDLRVSVLPTINGEKIVIRILNNSTSHLELKTLGFSQELEKKIKKMIELPYGILLVSGPTGSGKSTSLYSFLKLLNDTKKNIVTIEDPVEMKIKGINQVQVREDLGLNFSEALRSILRQDPDIIMIGEIRDNITAQIAVRASLTGHLVLSTIHTNSAIDTVVRLNDMGIESFLLSNALLGVLAQRLVRKLCNECSVYDNVSEAEFEIFKKFGYDHVKKVKRAVGCSFCGHKGYLGRIGIYELVVVDEEVRRMISKNVNVDDIKSYLKGNDVKFLVEDGLFKVMKGLTTIEEVISATVDYTN